MYGGGFLFGLFAIWRIEGFYQLFKPVLFEPPYGVETFQKLGNVTFF